MLLRAVSTKITIGVATVAALGLAPLAHADDTLFINVLDKEGVEYSSPTNAKVMGQAACAALEEGDSGQAITDAIVKAGFSSRDAGKIVAASVIGLCPQDKPLMNAAFGTDF